LLGSVRPDLAPACGCRDPTSLTWLSCFVHAEAGRLRGTFRPTDLGFFTIDLASSFRSAMELSRLDYVVDCDTAPSKDMLVFADRDFWEKVVFNLIGNAYKYTLSGSITVTAKYRPEGFVFSVKDTGVGIAKPEQELVFERFHRVEGTARSHEGTGATRFFARSRAKRIVLH
jgi:signal transduction histidine kinase